MTRLIAHYCDLLERLGSVREQDSSTNQMSFLIAMLPVDEQGRLIKRALVQLRDGITECANGKE